MSYPVTKLATVTGKKLLVNAAPIQISDAERPRRARDRPRACAAMRPRSINIGGRRPRPMRFVRLTIMIRLRTPHTTPRSPAYTPQSTSTIYGSRNYQKYYKPTIKSPQKFHRKFLGRPRLRPRPPPPAAARARPRCAVPFHPLHPTTCY
ncbi:unnamed protein product, partial [Brenthis ino]